MGAVTKKIPEREIFLVSFFESTDNLLNGK
jgi:hypothetical protein